MVSSDFGKLEARRHFTAGSDWAIAGMATVAATVVPAAPTAALLRNSRRFMGCPLLMGQAFALFDGVPGHRETSKLRASGPSICRARSGSGRKRHVADAQLDALAPAP